MSRSYKRRHFGGARAALVVVIAALVALCCLVGWHESQPADTPASPAASSTWEHPFPKVDWGWWAEQNPDVVAWLTIPGTGVDGPVCAAPAGDPDYYLDHDAYRNPSAHGCLYIDYSSGSDLFAAPNTVICGHNGGDGLMLADAAHYADAGWAEEHATIYVQTPEGAWAYQMAASEVISGWTAAKRASFADQASFERWWGERMSNASVLRTDGAPDVAATYQWATLASDEEAPSVETIAPREHLITLCTCSYYLRPANERTLTYAVARPADNLLFQELS